MARKPADQSVNRDDILLAAADVLGRNGYEATTMKDIAAAVNLTAASLYHHFRNKDALLLAVLEAGLEYVIHQIETIAQSNQAPDEKLRLMVREHVVGVTEHTAVGAAMIFEIRSLMGVNPPPANASVADKDDYAQFIARRDSFFVRRDQFEKLFQGVIQEGIEAGAFRAVDVPVFTKTMLGAHNWVGVWYKAGGRLNGQQIADEMGDAFLHALRP